MAIIANKNIKELIGKVSSTKMEKTLVVEVDKVKMHSLYKKRFIKTKKYYAHVEADANVTEGDVVRIQESKPTSKLKRWKFIEIVKKHQE